MGRDYIRIRSNSTREQALEEAKEALQVDQDSEAIELALQHTAESAKNLEAVKDEIPPELAEQLSTDVLRLVMYPQIKS
jgi:hypothetical protein